MPETVHGESDEIVELDLQLLDAKTSIPSPRSGFVSRRALIDSAQASDRRVVAITAPAGYGKSTLLTEWAALEKRPVAWVSLDRFDDDPAVLVEVIAAAYARISPADAEILTAMRGSGASVLARMVPRLASLLRASTAPFVLMLDDLHEVHSDAAHDALGILIGGIPAGSQLVAASRTEQPHVALFRASGDAVELGADDLALDASGAEVIFAQAQIPLSHDAAVAVAERTEGWPVGLYLAAVIAREQGTDTPNVSGEDPFVADYLYRESLRTLVEPLQRFLRRSAVLERLTAPLCDVVVDEPGSQRVLRELEALNLFVVPLDRERKWYRYHPLFREFLLGELRRVEPDVVVDLHSRAADWYESNDAPALALEHLFETSETERTVEFVAKLTLPVYRAGQLSTVQRWFGILGPATIQSHPALAVLAGWMAALTGQIVEAEHWATIIDATSDEAVPVDGSASFASSRAMLRAVMCPDGPERMMEDATLALDDEPIWSPWHDLALYLCAEAHVLLGNVTTAERQFIDGAALALEMAHPEAYAMNQTGRALLEIDNGRWEEAAMRTRSALVEIERARIQDFATSALAFAVAARVALHNGDGADARKKITQAMRARLACSSAMPFLAVSAGLEIARVHLGLGEPSTADQLLREIDEVLRVRPKLGTLPDQVSEFRMQLARNTHAAQNVGPPLTPAELRLVPYLQTHLSIREIGERLFVSKNTVSSEVSSIYRKLGVSTRSAAVERATAIGMLGDEESALGGERIV